MQEDADAEEQATVREAASIANMIVNSDCFRDFMAARKLVETNGRSPVDVARQLQDLSGRISVAFYYRCMKLADDCPEPTLAVAYRQPPDHAINLNRAYYDVRGGRFDIHELAGTLAHEAIGHVLGGYDHSFDWTPERDFSVPYSISGASIANGDAFLACRGETTGRE